MIVYTLFCVVSLALHPSRDSSCNQLSWLQTILISKQKWRMGYHSVLFSEFAVGEDLWFLGARYQKYFILKSTFLFSNFSGFSQKLGGPGFSKIQSALDPGQKTFPVESNTKTDQSTFAFNQV